MTFKAIVYRVMLASPSDVEDERREFSRILDNWNALYAAHSKAVLLPVRWETHSTPELGNRPQAILNEQLVDDADILVAIFWTRLGTATGAAASGSVEEIEQFRLKQKPVLIYFSDIPLPPNKINIEQYQSLTRYREKCHREALVPSYSSIGEFREVVLRNLWETVHRTPRTVRRLESRGKLTKESVNPTKYDAKQTKAIADKAMQLYRLLTPAQKQQLRRNLTQA